MANVTAIQILQDGPRNAVVKMTGILDTSDLTRTDLVDPATLTSMNPAYGANALASSVTISHIDFMVEDGLEVRLYWDATADVLATTLMGQGDMEFEDRFGGLVNNAGAGKTGKLQIETQGWAATQLLGFTVIVYLRKHGTFA